MATEDEQRKFNDYIEKALKTLKKGYYLDFAYELERQYKILSNKEKYLNNDIPIYSVDKYPELFKNLSEEDLESIVEYYEILKKVGEILDKYSDGKENY